PTEEPPYEGGKVSEYVMSLARAKALAVAQLYPDDTVIGADTVVAYQGDVLGKPRDKEHAFQMLSSMSGGAQEVYTGVCILKNGKEYSFFEKTDVLFKELSEKEISDYVETGDCLDKAGAYGIQGGAGEFVCGVSGDYFNVIGLPMKACSEVLSEILKTHSEW
ncbi:MAG: septum formation protein Maf, partial [Oscillospiraceae bacterium]|nr:septum formation protein Maf [Oscillospiraceae bacterium]